MTTALQKYTFLFWALLALTLLGSVVCATPLRAAEVPLEVSAAGSLEWDRAAKTYTARGKAAAQKGDLRIEADTLTAHYNNAQDPGDITKLIATGHVMIKHPPYTAQGDQATYDTQRGTAILSGKNLAIKTETEMLTAQEKIEFSLTENHLRASGGALAKRGTDTLTAKTLEAWFMEDDQGKLGLERMTATENVTIKTARETVHGDNGVYNVVKNKATLSGNVYIYQGENVIEGTRADVDLATGISKLFAQDNPATDGRVKGIFYPKK